MLLAPWPENLPCLKLSRIDPRISSRSESSSELSSPDSARVSDGGGIPRVMASSPRTPEQRKHFYLSGRFTRHRAQYQPLRMSTVSRTNCVCCPWMALTSSFAGSYCSLGLGLPRSRLMLMRAMLTQRRSAATCRGIHPSARQPRNLTAPWPPLG